jgi:protein-tyrosine phosphatase
VIVGKDRVALHATISILVISRMGNLSVACTSVRRKRPPNNILLIWALIVIKNESILLF